MSRPRAAAAALAALAALSCVGSGYDPHPDRSPSDDRHRDGPAASCLHSPLATPYYSTSFSDFATAWGTGGTGAWSTKDGALIQSSQTSQLAFAYHPVSIADYRMVATLHASSGGDGRALELALRIDPKVPSMYHCNWQPADGMLIIMYTGPGATDVGTLAIKPVDLGAVPVWNRVTMEFQAVGSQLQCCLPGIPDALLSVSDPRFGSGAVGMKTYAMSGSYRDVVVYR